MKTLRFSIFILALLTLPIAAKAQFQTGERFIAGGLNFNLNDSKFKGQNSTIQSSSYGHVVRLSLGRFTQNNRSVGWDLSHSIMLEKDPALQFFVNNPGKLRSIGFGVSRFIEYYKPVSEKFALYVRPDAGLSYRLNDSYNRVGLDDNGSIILSQRLDHLFSLGLNLSAGIAWRITPKWALYGSFALANLISVSAGWRHIITPPADNPQSEPIRIKGNSLSYDFSPSLSSGQIGLGFRYFYARK